MRESKFLFLAVILGTGCGSSDADEATSATTTSGSGGATSSASATTGAGAGTPGECGAICGAPAVPATDAGLSSFAPPGCDGDNFTRSFAVEIGSDGSKSVPLFADMDADGMLDVVVNARKAPSAMVFSGQGNGSFAARPVVLPQGGAFAGGWGIDLGDIDGNGTLDVAAGDHVSGALAWLNQGSLSFSLATTGLPIGTFNGVGLGDVNGDGHLDAVFGADQFSSGLQLTLGSGSGAWSPASAPALTSSAAQNAGVIAFFDHDGDGDLAVFAFGQSSTMGGIIAYVFDNAAGELSGFAQLNGGTGNTIGNPVQGSIADVDCDGVIDVAAGGSVYRGRSSGWGLLSQVADARIAHFGDLDGDGSVDLVVHAENSGLVAYRNEGSAFTQLDVGLPDAAYIAPELGSGDIVPLSSAYGIDLADVDGDGTLDVARTYCALKTEGFTNQTRCFLEVWVRG